MNEEILNKRKIFAAKLEGHAIEGMNTCIKKENEKEKIERTEEQRIRLEALVNNVKKQVEEIVTSDVEIEYINQFGELTDGEKRQRKGVLKRHITRVSKKVAKEVDVDASIEELREKVLEELNKNDKIKIALGNITKNENMKFKNLQGHETMTDEDKFNKEWEEIAEAKKETAKKRKDYEPVSDNELEIINDGDDDGDSDGEPGKSVSLPNSGEPDNGPVPDNEPEIINNDGNDKLDGDNNVEGEQVIIDMEPNEDGQFEQVGESNEVDLSLENLKNAMEDARRIYARTHYKSEGLKNRIKGFFGEGNTPVDEDVISMRDNYRQALEAFRNGKLAGLEELSELEQKEKLLELKSFDLNEKIDLYDERTAIRVEKSPSITQMTLGAIKSYKGVKTRYKIALAGVLFTGGLVAGSAGAGVFGAAAIAKKLLSAGGVGIGVTAGFEAKAQNKEKKDIDKKMEISKELSIEDLKADLEKFNAESFKKDIDESFKKKIAGRTRREFYGIAAAMGITILGNYGKLFTGNDALPEVGDDTPSSLTPDAVKTIQGGTVNEELLRQRAQEAFVQYNLTGEVPNISETIDAAESSVDKLTDVSVTIKPGDNLWNLIKGQLETNNQLAGMSDDQRIMAIDELKDKFAAMSPDELRKIGFTSGNINEIYPGNELNLTGVMSNTETIQHALETGQNFEGSLSVEAGESLEPGQVQDKFEELTNDALVVELNKDGALVKALNRELREIVGPKASAVTVQDVRKTSFDDIDDLNKDIQANVLSIIARSKEVLGDTIGEPLKGKGHTIQGYLSRIFIEAARKGKINDIFPNAKLDV